MEQLTERQRSGGGRRVREDTDNPFGVVRHSQSSKEPDKTLVAPDQPLCLSDSLDPRSPFTDKPRATRPCTGFHATWNRSVFFSCRERSGTCAQVAPRLSKAASSAHANQTSSRPHRGCAPYSNDVRYGDWHPIARQICQSRGMRTDCVCGEGGAYWCALLTHSHMLMSTRKNAVKARAHSCDQLGMITICRRLRRARIAASASTARLRSAV